MAPFFNDPNLEEEEDEDQPILQSSGGGAVMDSSGGGGTPAGNPQKQLNTGSGFQNLDKYLAANGNQFANQFVDKVAGEVGNAHKGFDTAAQQFKSQTNERNRVPGQDRINEAIRNPSSTTPEQYKGWRTQNFQGPKDLAGSPSAWNQHWTGVKRANQVTDLLSQQPVEHKGGTYALLDAYYGRPGYSPGEKSLDSLLIQNGGTGQRQADLKHQSARLSGTARDRAKELSEYAAQKSGEVDRSRMSAQNSVRPAIEQEEKLANDELTQAKNKRDDQVRIYNDLLNENTIQESESKPRGLSEGQSLYGVNPSNYFKAGKPLTINQTLRPEQRTRIQALNDLSGTTNTFAPGEAEGREDPTFDFDRFLNDIKAGKAGYDREYKGAGFDYYSPDPLEAKRAIQRDIAASEANPALDILGIGRQTGRGQINLLDRLNEKYKYGQKLKVRR